MFQIYDAAFSSDGKIIVASHQSSDSFGIWNLAETLEKFLAGKLMKDIVG